MKTWKKLLLGFAGIFALTTLAACSSSKDTLEKVQDKGTLTVALNHTLLLLNSRQSKMVRIRLLELMSKLLRLLQMSLV